MRSTGTKILINKTWEIKEEHELAYFQLFILIYNSLNHDNLDRFVDWYLFILIYNLVEFFVLLSAAKYPNPQSQT